MAPPPSRPGRPGSGAADRLEWTGCDGPINLERLTSRNFSRSRRPRGPSRSCQSSRTSSFLADS
jgi:hypothetical protein